MASLLTLQPSLSSSTWLAFDRAGKCTDANENDRRQVANLIDAHYAKWNKLAFKDDAERGIKKGVGIGGVIAGFETVVAWLLVYLQKSPATITNLLTTLSECVQVAIANYAQTKVNPENMRDPLEKEKAYKKLKADEEKRENWVATAVTAAGGLGLWKWGKEMLDYANGNENEIHELPLFQKVGLGVASLLNAFGMCSGYSEKCTLAPISENGGFRTEEMKLNGKSDGRCTMEWLTMTLFPFIVNMKPVKALFDLVLPLAAVTDGIGHFSERFEQFMEKHLKFLKDIHHKLFFREWFFGNKPDSGFRAIILKPIYELFGCNPPECYLKNDKLMVKLASSELKEEPSFEVKPNPIPIKEGQQKRRVAIK